MFLAKEKRPGADLPGPKMGGWEHEEIIYLNISAGKMKKINPTEMGWLDGRRLSRFRPPLLPGIKNPCSIRGLKMSAGNRQVAGQVPDLHAEEAGNVGQQVFFRL